MEELVPIQKFAIVFFIEGPLNDYVEKISADISDRFYIENLQKRIPPHFTLRYPFMLDNISRVENIIQEFLKNENSFKVSIGGFDRFEDNTKTVFLSVKENTILNSFIRRITDCIGYLDEDSRYDMEKSRKHVSVARHLDPEKSDIVFKYLKSLPEMEFDVLFNNVSIFYMRNNIWSVYKVFSFVDFCFHISSKYCPNLYIRKSS